MIAFFGTVIKFSMSEIDKVSESLYYNGTAYFDSTVIYISLDGFRNDYLDRKVTPNIDLLGKFLYRYLYTSCLTQMFFNGVAKQGIRAEYMNPSFPVSFIQANTIK